MHEINLTIGMACHDDILGVWPTVMSLIHHHGKHLGNYEVIVVDNNPESKDGRLTKSWAGNRMRGICRYIPFGEIKGTAQPRNEVFKQAKGKYTVCLDSHVILTDNCLPSLLEYYRENPDTSDLIVGPHLTDRG